MKDASLYSVVVDLVAHLRSVIDIDTLRGLFDTDHVIGGKLHLELPNGDKHILDVSLLNNIAIECLDEE